MVERASSRVDKVGTMRAMRARGSAKQRAPLPTAKARPIKRKAQDFLEAGVVYRTPEGEVVRAVLRAKVHKGPQSWFLVSKTHMVGDERKVKANGHVHTPDGDALETWSVFDLDSSGLLCKIEQLRDGARYLLPRGDEVTAELKAELPVSGGDPKRRPSVMKNQWVLWSKGLSPEPSVSQVLKRVKESDVKPRPTIYLLSKGREWDGRFPILSLWLGYETSTAPGMYSTGWYLDDLREAPSG